MYGKTTIDTGVLPTICRQCDMHCGINVHIENGKLVRISSLEVHLQNKGQLCPKGPAAVETVYHPDRLLKPLKRGKDGSFKEISLDRAMDEIVAKLVALKKQYGAKTVSCWQGEALGFAQQEKYARRFIHAFGSPNFFSCDSLCWAGRYLAYCLVQGFWNTCPDFKYADLVIFWGTNPPDSHPTFMVPLKEGRKKGSKLIVIDPRLTRIAKQADLHIRPLPGTDGALAWFMIRHLIEKGLYDKEFVEDHSVGFNDFSAYAKEFTLDYVAGQTGVSGNDIMQCCRMVEENLPKVVNYMGVSIEHQDNGVNTVRAIACLGALCGAIDIKGGDLWPESMGEQDLSLYKELPLKEVKPAGAEAYPVLYDMTRECHTITGMEYMLGNGEYPIRALILSGGNPANTNPNSIKVEKALSSLDLLVVRDMFLSETARLAHYVLPAASFLERSELHFCTQYQSVSLSTKVLEIPGVLDEYSFWYDLSHRLGFGEKYFPWKTESEVNRWLLGPTNITLEDLQSHPEGIQYKPVKYRKYQHTPFPTPSGKFEFSSSYLDNFGLPPLPEYKSPLYLRGDLKKYPFILISGARKSVFYHSRFRNLARFRRLHPRAEVEIHPEDAVSLGIKEGDRARVTSEMGSITLHVKIVKEIETIPGIIQITHGWEQEENVNRLTFDEINDPISGFPQLTSIPVQVERS